MRGNPDYQSPKNFELLVKHWQKCLPVYSSFSYRGRKTKQKVFLSSAAPLQLLSRLLRNCFYILITASLLNSLKYTLCLWYSYASPHLPTAKVFPQSASSLYLHAYNTVASPPPEAPPPVPLTPCLPTLLSPFMQNEPTAALLASALGHSKRTSQGVKRPRFHFCSKDRPVTSDTHFHFSELCLFVYKISGLDLSVVQTFFTVTHTLHCDSVYTFT